ncbi:MAG TPA: hypothetical protein VKB79_23130 [Bryobacteraceae bacterium]|nr:hypothetical protein [Bryobacteraceae bacterium]
MPLFTDGPCVSVNDLAQEDSGLLDVAQTAGINVSAKISLAHDEIAADLQLWLDRWRNFGQLWRTYVRLDQVAATPQIKRWETLQALALFYRDAYFTQLADRYQPKWDEYARLTRVAYDRFVAAGMGIVNDPVPQAAPPVLGTVTGPQKGGSYYASVAWLNASGQEGAASVPSSITFPDGNLMTISAFAQPSNAVGFNVYAGVSLDALYRQNNAPLPPNGTFTYVPGAITSGALPSAGQRPDFIRPLVRTIPRG